MAHEKRNLKFQTSEQSGVGILAVVMLTGVLAGAAGAVSNKVAENSRLLHREIRNPLSVKLTDVPFFQLVNDDTMCRTSNMMDGMSNFSLDGTLDSGLGNKIKEMDQLSYEIGGVSAPVYERKLGDRGLYTLLGLKEFEVWQTGPIIKETTQGISRVPATFVKIVISERQAQRVVVQGSASTTGQRQLRTGRGTGAVVVPSSGKSTNTTTTLGSLPQPPCSDPASIALAQQAYAAAIAKLGFRVWKSRKWPLIKRIKNGTLETELKLVAQQYLSDAGNTACISLVQASLVQAIRGANVFKKNLRGKKTIKTMITTAGSAAFSRIFGVGPTTPAIPAAESLPTGWATTDPIENLSYLTKNGITYEVKRIVMSKMYIEMNSDLTKAEACYSQLASRSLCVDVGGSFDPENAIKCQL